VAGVPRPSGADANLGLRELHPVGKGFFLTGKTYFRVGKRRFLIGKRPFPVWNAYFPIRKTGPLSSFLMKITGKPPKMTRAIPGTVTTAGRKSGPRTSNV